MNILCASAGPIVHNRASGAGAANCPHSSTGARTAFPRFGARAKPWADRPFGPSAQPRLLY